MQMSLSNAIIISAIIHVGLFTPFYNKNLINIELEKRRSIVVDYLVLKEIAQALKTDKEVALKIPETPKIDIKKEVDIKPQEPLKKEALASKSPEDTTNAEKRAAERKEAALKSNSDYINYYQLIREKIRARLKDNYRHYNREGDVYIAFTINQNGSLVSYSVDRSKSTSDEVLLHITAASLKAVSPFPGIPKNISMPQMSFSIMISFKK